MILENCKTKSQACYNCGETGHCIRFCSFLLLLLLLLPLSPSFKSCIPTVVKM
ncbi:uncharacterized protein BX663DRAFT_8855 [Cokeromyces recurvatus]|uniref:uncharacterized protein n=1 Tax=Cokeromyces recurvatus TaxID=90255 RepID=UPI00221F8A62|nr:uncharacterized protein BX663DRAFT_8855 [Cokeromyces recurvatus]KAI7907704.1 hypothetical protein BX663DRAFT_8855 [Cokeromyces recurvatus]